VAQPNNVAFAILFPAFDGNCSSAFSPMSLTLHYFVNQIISSIRPFPLVGGNEPAIALTPESAIAHIRGVLAGTAKAVTKSKPAPTASEMANWAGELKCDCENCMRDELYGVLTHFLSQARKWLG
jgi:hypothetical protein